MKILLKKRTSAVHRARLQSLLWLCGSMSALLGLYALSEILPFGFYSRLAYTFAVCLLGAAAAGASFMVSGWLCVATQIQAIPIIKMSSTYSRCTPEQICFRQYNIWRFRFFGMSRYLKNTDEREIIAMLEEGKEPKEIFSSL